MKNWEGMYLSREQAEKITEGAGKVLEEIGIKVTDKKSEEHLKDVIDDLMREAIDSTEVIHVK